MKQSNYISDWKESQVFYSDQELLQIFPEAEPYLREMLGMFRAGTDSLKRIIVKKLKAIKEEETGFAREFWESVLEITDGDLLEKSNKRIKKIESHLREDSPKSEITQADIERAKNHPITDILGVSSDRNLVLCPSPEHRDIHPSCQITKNFAYCHSCNYSADSIKLLMDTHKIGFVEAVKQLI